MTVPILGHDVTPTDIATTAPVRGGPIGYPAEPVGRSREVG